MKTTYPGYYPPSDAELTLLWDSGVFALDANVLLNLYRYSDETRTEFLSLLTQIAPRLWLPHQAGLEFHRNRLAVIAGQENAYRLLLKDYRNLLSSLEATRGHPFVRAALVSQLHDVLDEIEKDVKKSQDTLASLSSNDPVLDQLTKLFEGRVGEPLSAQIMEGLPADGEKRYQQRIPPGFEDRKKVDYKRFGDLIIWKELLSFAKQKQTPIILVTDDAKEDWWWQHSGKTLGPLPALKEEIQAQSGQPFHMYRPDRFLQYASSRLKATVKEEAISEVKDSSADGRESSALKQRLRLDEEALRSVRTARDIDEWLTAQEEALRQPWGRPDLEQRFRARDQALHDAWLRPALQERIRTQEEAIRRMQLPPDIEERFRAQEEEALRRAQLQPEMDARLRAQEEVLRRAHLQPDIEARFRAQEEALRRAQLQPDIEARFRAEEEALRRTQQPSAVPQQADQNLATNVPSAEPRNSGEAKDNAP